MTLKNGMIFDGEFLEERFHGRGKLIMTHSSSKYEDDKEKVFEGFFSHGHVPKEGKLTYPKNGNIYYGPHNNFRRQGHGLMIYG